MKKVLSFLLTFLLICSSAYADVLAPGWEESTIEELESARALIDSRLAELQESEVQANIDPSKPEIELLNEEIRINSRSSYSDLIPIFYVAELKNNTTTPIDIYNISVDFEDSSGSLVLTRSMLSIYPSVIMPGKSGYIHEKVSGFYGDEEFDPTSISTCYLHYSTRKKEGYSYPDITVSDIVIDNSDPDWRSVSCRLQNNTDSDFSLLTIVALAFDDNHSFLTEFVTYDDLNANDKKGFNLSDLYSDDSVNITGATIEVYAYNSF